MPNARATMQTAVHGGTSSHNRVVGFYEDPVDSFSRPVTRTESWACYHFEMHARKCEHCHNPYEVHRNHEHLCDVGHALAQDVARYLYQRSDGAIYSTTEEDNKLVRVEIPAGYVEVCSLLKAIERSLRHRSRRPFVSMDRSYYVAPRTPSEVPTGRATSVKVTEERPPLTKSSRTRSREIVDRPLFTEAVPGDAVEKSSLSKPASVDTDVEAQDRLGVKEATNRTDIYNLGYPIELDHNDDVSVTSSDEGSVFSIASLASSATDLSKGSGYSPVQIATATRELLSIFRDDEVLYPLYTTAIHGVIGPRKFVNTFMRMLKAFADKLKDEAQDRLDFLAARLVALKAREIADAILEIHQLGKAPDLVVVEGKRVTILERDDEDSSDEDEQEETNVDETGFEDLTNVREFLVQSAAFKLLRTDLQYYVSSKRQSKDPSSERDEKMYLDERVNGIAKLIEPGFQTCAHVQSTKSGVEQDCLNQLRNDRPLFELHLYALDILGEDRFVIEYSDLLRRYYSNAGASVDNKVDNRMGGNIDAQLGTVWQPVASAVVLHLEIADANESCWKDQTSDSKTDKSFFIDLLSREGKDLRCATTPHLLSRDLALLTLRRPLRELFTHTPGYIIEMTSVNNSSFVNRTKASLEDYTMAEWDWWPLAPRIPDVAPGECRLEWKFGGVQLYETLSSLEWNTVEYAMPSLPDHPKQCYCCHIGRHGKTSSATSPRSHDHIVAPERSQWCLSLPMTWIKAAAGTTANPSNSSTARQRYTPTETSATSMPLAGSQTAGGNTTNPSSVNSSNSTPQVSGQPATVTPSAVPDTSLRVLFGVQGSRWSLEVEQINVTTLLNDPAFFRELKTRYKKHRSWIKRLVSPFRFRFCRFVKLEKFDTGRVLSQGDDLPDYPGVKDDYEYDPRPGTNPMISPKIFAVCLKACDMNCKWRWLNPWHDCVSLPCRSYRLGCIPKKKSEFDIQSDDAIAVAWGLEADHAISFAFMAVYHLVPLLAAFGFWIYWLIKFPGDWQNAAVPVLTVLAIFAVLWVPFGKHLGMV